MLQIRKKILVGTLCASMVLSASQSVAWSENTSMTAEAGSSEATVEAETSEAADETYTAESEDTAADEEVEEPITEDGELAKCELAASNENFELYVNTQTGLFAFRTKDGKHTWWSNPYNADEDPRANNSKKADLKSTLVVNAVKVTDTDAPSTPLRSYSDGDVSVTLTDNGFRAEYYFENEGIWIPYYVSLDSDYIEASIAVDEIYEIEMQGPKDGDTTEISSDNGLRSVVDVNFLQDLGAAYSDEEGYIITPDGSGAVINFNNGKSNTNTYSQRIYGRDLAKSQDMAPAKTEQAYLPIMGIVRSDNALLEVVTEGTAYATANAAVSGQKATSYNSAWFNFQLRASDTYYMGGQNAQPLTAYQESKIPERRVTVRYYPIVKDGVSYVDVAKRYQQYLVEEKGLTKVDKEEAPLYLDVYGGTVKEQSILGFPVNLQTAATTYDQAKEILQELNNNGVKNIILSYEDFNTAGITSRISNSVDYAGTLGGKNKFKELKSYCEANGIILAPSVDLMNYDRSGNGYTKTGASAIAITKAYATQGVYELAFGTPHETRTAWYILSPAFFTRVYGEVISSYTKEGMQAISVATGTSALYSDYTSNAARSTSRQQAIENLIAGYKMINQSGMTFVAGAANDYVLPYVDYLKDVPLYSSNFDVYDYDIPFYELVIHGYIPYTTKAKNASSSADELFVYSVATGTPLHYEVMYEDPNEFTDSSYDELFYTYYSGWVEDICAEYKFMQQYVLPLTDETIEDFQRIDRYNYKTTFSDGTVIEVDLQSLKIVINGTEVKLSDFETKGATTD